MAENDVQSLRALTINAELSGGMVDLSGLGPNFREFVVEYLRELANRIEHPDGTYFDPHKCNCGEGDAFNHPNDCAAWVGPADEPANDGGNRIPTASRHGYQCATPECILDAGHPDHHESQLGKSWRTYPGVDHA